MYPTEGSEVSRNSGFPASDFNKYGTFSKILPAAGSIYWSPDIGGKGTYEFTPVRPFVRPELLERTTHKNFLKFCIKSSIHFARGKSILDF